MELLCYIFSPEKDIIQVEKISQKWLGLLRKACYYIFKHFLQCAFEPFFSILMLKSAMGSQNQEGGALKLSFSSLILVCAKGKENFTKQVTHSWDLASHPRHTRRVSL